MDYKWTALYLRQLKDRRKKQIRWRRRAIRYLKVPGNRPPKRNRKPPVNKKVLSLDYKIIAVLPWYMIFGEVQSRVWVSVASTMIFIKIRLD